MAGENLDLSSEPEGQRPAGEPSRPFVGVRFACCGIYCRVYRNAEGTAYEGHCPRCGQRVQARIGPHGRSERFFTVE